MFLTKVTSVDIGEYIFIVKSPNGVAEGNFHVNMTYASGYNVQDVTLSSTSSTASSFTLFLYNSPANYIHVIVFLLLLTIINEIVITGTDLE